MMRAELAAALQLLTRLPTNWLWAGAPAPLARSVWAWPLVGALLGAFGGLVDALARRLGLPPALAALWTLGSLLLLTGALHEDGLADAADGIFGGADPARRLAIMRDSRIGAFGALALLLSLGLRASALAALPGPGAVTLALIAAGAAGRAAMLGVLLILPPARTDGLAAGLGAPPVGPSAAGLAIGAAPALLLGGRGLWLLVLVGATTLGLARFARARLGGHSGDGLGAVEQSVECVALSLLAARGG